jgi:hypothetical protein
MKRLNILPLALMALSGFLLFALEQKLTGYGALCLSLASAFFINRELLRDLSLVAIGVFIVSLVPVTTDISFEHMLQMGLAMTAAVALPYLVSRYVYKNHLIRFPFGFKEPWHRAKWFYILLVLVVGYFIMPLYLIGTGMYMNWPAATDASSIVRLFIGTNALGTWDELFFICVVFVVFSKYVNFWTANLLQAVLFTSFLYELGFEGVGPLMIYLFALTQGYIFVRTHSVFYLLCVHLLFDFIMFLVLLHAHNREFLPIFLY